MKDQSDDQSQINLRNSWPNIYNLQTNSFSDGFENNNIFHCSSLAQILPPPLKIQMNHTGMKLNTALDQWWATSHEESLSQ